MPAREQRPGGADRDILAGVGRALGTAFPAHGAAPAEIQAELQRLGRGHRPDAAADARFDQLLDRLRRLPWGDKGDSQ